MNVETHHQERKSMKNDNPSLNTPFRIYPALLLWILTGLIGIAFVVWWILQQAITAFHIEHTKKETLLLAETIAMEIQKALQEHASAIEVWETKHLFTLYEEMGKPLGVVWIQVYDDQGRLLFGLDPNQIGRMYSELEGEPFPALQQAQVQLERLPPSHFLAQRGIRDVLEVYLPLPPRFRPAAWVEVYLDAEPLLARIRHLRQQLLGAFLALGLGLGALTWFFTRRADAIITAQQQTLQKTLEKLKRLEAHRRMMTSSLAHDIKNHLAAVQGTLEWFSQHLPEETDQDLLENGSRALIQATMMLDNLVAISRLEEEDLPVNLQPLPVVDFFSRLEAWAKPILSMKKASLEIEEPPSSLQVLADAHLLFRVGQNLIYNAIKHTPPETRIRLTARDAGSQGVAIQVQDNGPGISPEDLPRIFDKFYKGAHSHGSGLGLAFCRLAVEAMGGRITVQSQPGQGTTFTIWLPRSQSSSPGGGTKPSPEVG